MTDFYFENTTNVVLELKTLILLEDSSESVNYQSIILSAWADYMLEAETQEHRTMQLD